MSNLPRLNDVRRFGRSIIEEWKNPPKFNEDVLRSDQLYEERAIDVIPDYYFHSSKDYKKDYKNDNSKESKDPVKLRDDKKNALKGRQSNSGTVRSIPIRNYQASIAYNIGTLRRSEAPQLQFESSISEPEKNLLKSKEPLTRVSKRSETGNPSRRSCHSCDYQREIRNSNSQINSKLKTLDRRIVKSEHNVSTRDEDRDITDLDDYFHKSSSQKLTSSRRWLKDKKSRSRRKEETKIYDKPSKSDETRVSRKWGTIALERGHVGQKISAYEENAKRTGRNWDFTDKYQVFPEMNKHRAIGVPLVGMHNACGLPVVTSWQDHELLDQHGRVLGTLRPIFKGPRASLAPRHRTHPKRKMSHTNQSISKRSTLRDSDKGIDYPSIRSLVSVGSGSGSGISKRRKRRPSFKTKKPGTSSSKNSLKRKNKSDVKKNKENTFEPGNSKRQTLYARDDGEDAVQVLKNLCLNPLARTKSETGMIW